MPVFCLPLKVGEGVCRKEDVKPGEMDLVTSGFPSTLAAVTGRRNTVKLLSYSTQSWELIGRFSLGPVPSNTLSLLITLANSPGVSVAHSN